jgi:hypothetical protein
MTRVVREAGRSETGIVRENGQSKGLRVRDWDSQRKRAVKGTDMTIRTARGTRVTRSTQGDQKYSR